MKNDKTSSLMNSRPGLVEIAILIACLLLLAGFSSVDGKSRYAPPPAFSDMDVEEKKRQFFAYLSPMISDVNFRLAAERDRVHRLRAALAVGEKIGWSDRRWLKRLAARLDVDMDSMPLEDALGLLERRAGIVPESLVLVQAAVESGWGSSRFALEGNNYFGQRCYSDDCGMVPEQLPEGENFGLAEFDSPAESIESYILNLNTHESYREFRAQRERRREAGEPITGLALVAALENYSERGDEYVDQIAAMIRANNLE